MAKSEKELPQESPLARLRAELVEADAEHDANCERVRQSANRRAAILDEIESLENE